MKNYQKVTIVAMGATVVYFSIIPHYCESTPIDQRSLYVDEFQMQCETLSEKHNDAPENSYDTQPRLTSTTTTMGTASQSTSTSTTTTL